MTIGPAPMMRMLLRSLRLGIAHQLGEAVEEIADVVRPGARLRVALEAERRAVGAGEALQRAIEERDVRRPQMGGHARRVVGEAVVLAGGEALARVMEL